MKLFTTSNIVIAKECQRMFGFEVTIHVVCY